jgi:hypothetical protein
MHPHGFFFKTLSTSTTMIKIFIGFIVFSALAMFILFNGGDIDMSGEKHGIDHPPEPAAAAKAPAESSPPAPAAPAPATAPAAAPAGK